MKPGLFQILIIVLIVVLLFGRGRISELLGDFGRGVKNFRSGIDGQRDGELGRSHPDLPIEGSVTRPAEDATRSG